MPSDPNNSPDNELRSFLYGVGAGFVIELLFIVIIFLVSK